MNIRIRAGRSALLLVSLALGAALLIAAACGGSSDDKEPTATTAPAATAVPTEPQAQETATPEPDDHADGEIAFDAASATITVDGDSADWDGIEGATVTLEQFVLPEGVTFADLDWDEPSPVGPFEATLKVATDTENIYVLFEVADDYDFDPADHGLTASPNVMFLIDPGAGSHMGAGDDDFTETLGMVDIWHWEIECASGELAGAAEEPGSGNGACNLDDEFSTDPEEREDDGGGDANPNAETSIVGAWTHSASAEGIGAAGTWVFEFSRPLQTGDPEDAQFASGGTALIALAYFDADETAEGWTAEGHAVSSEAGWIDVTLP